ncbi:thymidine kinase [Pseudogracilibacillus auburnensis]|uniref:Thymidine kinase n=1 Tax=Pseudogracilibacillus auburnensis TaxID=1494959 RepID=A0A2V3W825_9BACI|nr:thymidine kinase [Pseudogracilibacillus auburnensis]MBO1003717.1 thymidine kinase [Pseudogracilibacillus auburnensis]PXW90272.1 thymidine kinase [Pseudogracilibacillus auburnensis]
MAKLFFYYSTMAAGKSMEIIKVAYNYEVQGKKVVAITSKLDNRYESGKIWSRAGFEMDAYTFDVHTDMKDLVLSMETRPTSVLIDEAQFLNKKQVIELTDLADDYHITVMCYGLKNDSFNNLFEGSESLLIYADNIKELKTECWFCHKKATMVLRFDEEGYPVYEGAQIEIGGNEKYLPVCRTCYKSVEHINQNNA